MIQQMVRTRNIRHHQEHLQRQILLSITEKESGEKFLNFVDSFLDIVVIIALVLFAVLLIVVIITSVKLHYRDLELDDLYDEYGIDMDEEEAEKKIQKKCCEKK